MDLYSSSGLTSYDGVNYGWKGDYLGFTIGNIHSSSLGIVRISDSDRYNEELTPNYTDITATVPGLDETYYFGSTYTQRTFTIKFAFDHLTDIQIRKLRQIFSKKEPQDLIFDETPYKVYTVKSNGQPNLSYICFEEDFQRIYKGDGSVTFIAYCPFARSRFKYLEDYNIKNIPEWGGVQDNKMEWLESSGIKSRDYKINGLTIDKINEPEENESYAIQLYNPGDLPSYCKIGIYIGDNVAGKNAAGTLSFKKGNREELLLSYSFKDFDIAPEAFLIDNKRRLILGVEYVRNEQDEQVDFTNPSSYNRRRFFFNPPSR